MKTRVWTWVRTGLMVIALVRFPLAQSDSAAGDSADTQVITIVNSGFWSSDTIVIKYRMADWKVVSVTRNGKEVPQSEYDDYVSDLFSARESAELRRVVPKIHELEKRLDLPDIPDSVKLADLAETLKALRPLESDMAQTYAGVLETRQWRLFKPYLIADVRAELEKSGFTPARGFEEFTIGSEHCLVDGVQLPEELATKIRNIFARYRGIELQEKEEVTYNLEKDRENPQIKRKITH